MLFSQTPNVVFTGSWWDFKHPDHWVKGKSIPLQTWTGPEGSRRLRLPDFKTIGK
jgi:hypothetical protein